MPKGISFSSLSQSATFLAEEDGDLVLPASFLNGGAKYDLIRRGTPKDPPWIKMGTGKTNRAGKSMGFTQTIRDLTCSIPAINLLTLSIESMNSENVVVIQTAGMTPSEEKAYRRGLKVLLDKGIFKRVKNRHYMINPSLVLPWENGEALRARWDSL